MVGAREEYECVSGEMEQERRGCHIIRGDGAGEECHVSGGERGVM